MSSYLLDTDVLSALAPGRPPPAPAVAEWLEEHSDALFLSVISVVEIEAGVRCLANVDFDSLVHRERVGRQRQKQSALVGERFAHRARPVFDPLPVA